LSFSTFENAPLIPKNGVLEPKTLKVGIHSFPA